MNKQPRVSESTERILRSLVDSRWNTIGPSQCPTCGAPQPDYEIKGGAIVCAHCQTKLTMVPSKEKAIEPKAPLDYDEENPLSKKNAKLYVVMGFIFLMMTVLFVAVFIKSASIAVGILICAFGWITVNCFKNGHAIIKANNTGKL